MENNNLPKGWKYEVFDKKENPIAKYRSIQLHSYDGAVCRATSKRDKGYSI